MTPYQTAIAKLQQLPDPLVNEVNHFIDQLLALRTADFAPTPESDLTSLMKLAETGFSEWNDPEEDIYGE